MDTLQNANSNIQMEIAKNFTILADGNRYTEHELRNGSSHHDADLNVNGLQQTVSMMMMKRTTEQITDVSCGNTAALAQDQPLPLTFGTLTTIENAHNTADTNEVLRVSSREDRSDVQGQTRTAFESDQSPEKETEEHLREQDGLRHCIQQAIKFRRDLERDEERVEQDDESDRASAEMERTIRITEKGDDSELDHRFQSSRFVSILRCT